MNLCSNLTATSTSYLGKLVNVFFYSAGLMPFIALINTKLKVDSCLRWGSLEADHEMRTCIPWRKSEGREGDTG